MASIIKNQNVTENSFHNLLRDWAIKLRYVENLYAGLERGRKAAAALKIVEGDLVKLTGKTW